MKYHSSIELLVLEKCPTYPWHCPGLEPVSPPSPRDAFLPAGPYLLPGLVLGPAQTAAPKPLMKAIYKAVHAPFKLASHPPLQALGYIVWWGCEAAQDKLMSQPCWSCGCLLSASMPLREGLSPWASPRGVSFRTLGDLFLWLRGCPSCVATRGPGLKMGPPEPAGL